MIVAPYVSYVYRCLIEFINQIIKINWDVSKTSKKRSKTIPVKINNSFDYFIKKGLNEKVLKLIMMLFLLLLFAKYIYTFSPSNVLGSLFRVFLNFLNISVIKYT